MKNTDKRRAVARELSKHPELPFEQLDLKTMDHPAFMTRCFRNNRYIVMIDDKSPTSRGPAIRAMVQNHSGMPIVNHWREMQRIKNEIFGPESVAVEYYPAESQMIDMANIYWLWVFPHGVLPIPTNGPVLKSEQDETYKEQLKEPYH